MRKLIFFIILEALFSCTNDGEKELYESFTKNELKFIAKFDHELLNLMARKTLSLQHKKGVSGCCSKIGSYLIGKRFLFPAPLSHELILREIKQIPVQSPYEGFTR